MSDAEFDVAVAEIIAASSEAIVAADALLLIQKVRALKEERALERLTAS